MALRAVRIIRNNEPSRPVSSTGDQHCAKIFIPEGERTFLKT